MIAVLLVAVAVAFLLGFLVGVDFTLDDLDTHPVYTQGDSPA